MQDSATSCVARRARQEPHRGFRRHSDG
jgi:hypothetical protein